MKEVMPKIVGLLAKSGDEGDGELKVIEMSMVKHVFRNQLRRFYKTKSLTKGLKSADSDQEEDANLDLDDASSIEDGESEMEMAGVGEKVAKKDD